jgi:TonB dependent receptor/Carboxypeptidase regulatory-like domain/TonB-dependent Receptor Plug Domain
MGIALVQEILSLSRCVAMTIALAVVLSPGSAAANDAGLTGQVIDPQGKAVPDAIVRLLSEERIAVQQTKTDAQGQFQFVSVPQGEYHLTVDAADFNTIARDISVKTGEPISETIQFSEIRSQSQSVLITSNVLEPGVDLRNAEVFDRTLFTRDDQVFKQLNAGLNVGQHEGGGKSLEIRRFGFNLDHGGVNGGLKVLVDDVQQNQGTQGHGQGYLGALKALSPELIEDVKIINGPFSAEYGDFSGLGVVHIHQRESLPEQFMIRLQGGNFDTARGFIGYSPDIEHLDAYISYEGSYTDGPFINAGRYHRDNVNGNFTKALSGNQKLGFRFIYGRNNFYSSGQVPLDLVNEGLLDRFGYIDPSDGGRVNLGTFATYYSKQFSNSDTLKIDGFIGRSLFDLYSNFTFFLNDPVHGDGIQQHDSRLQEAANAQYVHAHHVGSLAAVLTAGGNLHASQINVGLYPREGRVPLGVTTRADADVTNAAGYVQETVSMLKNRLIVGAGMRFDEFWFDVTDKIVPSQSGLQTQGRWEPKANVAFTPSKSVPLTLYANYGRGINSVDARGVVQRPESPRVATTDFYQVGTSSNFGKFAFSEDFFLIDHSNEQVYIPDDGSFEFKGRSRSYGFEVKTSVQITRYLALNAGMTKVLNSFFQGGEHRVYVDSAPHFVANSALTLAGWRGWSGSFRFGAINHYRLDGDDPSIVASGFTTFDLGLAKQIHRGVELNLSMDNVTNRDYYETQNYLESRVCPTCPVVARIHGTPAYPFTVVAGVTFRLWGK